MTTGRLIMVMATATALAMGCGDDSSKEDAGAGTGGTGATAGSAGAGGTGGDGGTGATDGGMTGPPTTTCGTETCEGIEIGPPLSTNLDPCCPPMTDNTCGLDVTAAAVLGLEFEETCQERDQASVPDDAMVCPNSEKIDVLGFAEIELEGCCREATNTCGYIVDQVLIVNFGLGCAESPFADDAVIDCGK